MAYGVKYRAETYTSRQDKLIRVDILEDGYTDPVVTGWTNDAVNAYETLTTSGTIISSAINSSGSGYCYSNDITITSGEIYTVEVNLTLNSGTAPIVYLWKNGVGAISSTPTLAEGLNKIELTATQGTATGRLYFGNTSSGNWSTGAIELTRPVKLGQNPVVISQPPVAEPFDGQIIGSEARINLISETFQQFLEFFDCTSREYQVKIYFDSVNVWNGYVVPDMYNEPYNAPPYESTLVATDGIGNLQGIVYEEIGAEVIQDIVAGALTDYLDVHWDWHDYILYNLQGTTGFYETTNGMDAGDCMIDVSRFVAESRAEYSTIYDILGQICKTFDARLFIDEGYWRLDRPASKRRVDQYYTKYSKGAGTSTGIENNHRAITLPGAADGTVNHFMGGNQRLSILPALQKFTIVHDYGYRPLTWKDPSFEYDPITTHWEAQGGFSLSSSNQVGRELQLIGSYNARQTRGRRKDWFKQQVKKWSKASDFHSVRYEGVAGLYYDFYKYLPSEKCISFGTGNTTSSSILSSGRVHYIDTFTVQNTAAANYGVQVSFDQRALWSGTAPDTSVYIRAYNASWDRWLDKNGIWQSGPNAIEFDLDTSMEWQSFEVTSGELTTSYEVAIHVYLSTSVGGSSVTGTWIDNIDVSVVRIDTDPMSIENELEQTVNSDHILVTDFEPRVLGDINEEGYETTIYTGHLTDLSGNKSAAWQIDGSVHQTLLEHSRDMHRCMRENPLRKLTGTLYGLNSFRTVLVEDTPYITEIVEKQGYETFVSSGTRIISAINTTYSGFAKSDAFTVYDGDEISVYIDLTLYSGTAPYVRLYKISPSILISNNVQLSNGVNVITLTATADSGTGNCEFLIYNMSGDTSSYSTGEIYLEDKAARKYFTNYASWNLEEMAWSGEWVELPEVATETTNLITGWTNDDWDTFTNTDEVIDSAIEGTGAADANSNSISHDSGEDFTLTWDVTKNSGDWVTINFAGDSHTIDAATGTTTLTATSTSSSAVGFDLGAGETANYGECTIYLYRKYGW